MKFTAAYEQDIPGLDYSVKAEADTLAELRELLEASEFNDYHMIVVEWDYTEVDAYGSPEAKASARYFELSPEMENLDEFDY